jgi:hypothetical protein
MDEQKSPSIAVAEWLSYHQTLIEDIKFAKSQQWRLAYYVLLLQGAIIGLSKTLPTHNVTIIILSMATLFIAIFGTYFLLKFQNDMTRYRSNIKKVRSKFPSDLKEIATYESAEGDPAYYSGFLYFIISFIWLGAILVGWSIGFWNFIFCR